MARLPIIGADQRLQLRAAVKGQLWGGYGSGKTFQVKRLKESSEPDSDVLVLDAEGGLLCRS